MSRRERAIKPLHLIGPLTEVERLHAPRALHVRGDLRLFDRGARVSVVGTRRPTELGRGRAATLVRELVGAGVVVVSGLAEGIDTVAHRTAIERGGRTIAVLGTPLDRPYPKSNAGLLETIARDHLAI